MKTNHTTIIIITTVIIYINNNYNNVENIIKKNYDHQNQGHKKIKNSIKEELEMRYQICLKKKISEYFIVHHFIIIS